MFDWFLIQCIVDIPVVVFAQNKQKRTKGFVNVRDINQGLFLIFFIRAVWIWCWYVLDLLNMMICFSWYTELLLGIPELLPRLVNLAVSRDCKYWYWYKTSTMYCLLFFNCFKRIHLKCSISVQKDKRPEAKC